MRCSTHAGKWTRMVRRKETFCPTGPGRAGAAVHLIELYDARPRPEHASGKPHGPGAGTVRQRNRHFAVRFRNAVAAGEYHAGIRERVSYHNDSSPTSAHPAGSNYNAEHIHNRLLTSAVTQDHGGCRGGGECGLSCYGEARAGIADHSGETALSGKVLVGIGERKGVEIPALARYASCALSGRGRCQTGRAARIGALSVSFRQTCVQRVTHQLRADWSRETRFTSAGRPTAVG